MRSCKGSTQLCPSPSCARLPRVFLVVRPDFGGEPHDGGRVEPVLEDPQMRLQTGEHGARIEMHARAEAEHHEWDRRVGLRRT
eukprot:127910-Pleurochrysis_carterae.AAC.6